MMTEPTLQKLDDLRLFTMKDAWLKQNAPNTECQGMDFDERFGLLVDAEFLQRENRKRDRRLKEAKLKHAAASLEDFEQAKLRGIEPSLRNSLMTCGWIDEHLSVVITGKTGVGKTYLACALGQHACRHGYRVLYRRTPRLLDELALARTDGSLPRLFDKFARTHLLILDDWGITPLRDQDRRDLLEVLDDRDGVRSSILASQIPTKNWHDYLGDPTIADAIADRLLPRAHQIVLKGPSRRVKTTQEITNE
mgnify:CR=1 FL=1